MSKAKFYCREKVSCEHRDAETDECDHDPKEGCDFKTTKKPGSKKKRRWGF